MNDSINRSIKSLAIACLVLLDKMSASKLLKAPPGGWKHSLPPSGKPGGDMAGLRLECFWNMMERPQ